MTTKIRVFSHKRRMAIPLRLKDVETLFGFAVQKIRPGGSFLDISDRVPALVQDAHDEKLPGADRVEDDVTLVGKLAVTGPDAFSRATHLRVAAEQP